MKLVCWCLALFYDNGKEHFMFHDDKFVKPFVKVTLVLIGDSLSQKCLCAKRNLTVSLILAFTAAPSYRQHATPEPSSEGKAEVELRLMGHLRDCSL